MARPVRSMLADSHVGAVAVLVLLLWSIESLFRAIWVPLSRIGGFLLTAIAILDIPYYAPGLTTLDKIWLVGIGVYLYAAVVSFAGAHLVARCVYGMGPARLLASYRKKIEATCSHD